MVGILFVCHGNICRSPMAEFVMKDLVRRNGTGAMFSIASAATSTEEIGNGVYPPVRRLLERHGMECPARKARQITRSDYAQYDYIVGMDAENLRNMKRAFGGDPDGRLHLLLDFTDRPGNVADPWYTRDFDATWHDVQKGCAALYDHIRNAGQI